MGIGVFGSYIPSFTIPHIGEMGTLWLALLFCATGGIIALVSMRLIPKRTRHMQNLTTREKFAELGARGDAALYQPQHSVLEHCAHYQHPVAVWFCGDHADDVC